ncbi:MAG: hypothetical protein K2L82_13855 [Lachnospiraceae bacterium]|nr:hypothetical protein [Lachnospiraceae bacterium]
MPWCPVCKNEYREGIKLCAECKVELVEHLEDDKEQSTVLSEQEKIARVRALLADEKDGLDEEEDEIPEKIPVYHAYRNSAAKAEDNRTSAYTLLFVGIIGFILVLLIFVGIIPLYQNATTTKYLLCGVMGAMFILFIVFGVVSMRNSKILLIKAKSEDSLLSELTKWCEKNLDAEQIDTGLFDDNIEQEIAEEQKYFMRSDRMKMIISDNFMNLDEAFLEHFVDEYYQELFENK